jgi:hypothetical protein
MARLTAKRLGEGARCSVLVKLLRPSREVAAIPNTTSQQRLNDLIATHLGMTDRQGHNFESFFFTLVSIPGIILSCATRNCIVREDGHPDAFWDVPERAWRRGRGAIAVPGGRIRRGAGRDRRGYFSSRKSGGGHRQCPGAGI